MNIQEAENIVLKHLLSQAKNKITFLEDCINYPNQFSYQHPEQTKNLLKDMDNILQEETYCVHSTAHNDCPSCQERITKHKLLQQALKVLSV